MNTSFTKVSAHLIQGGHVIKPGNVGQDPTDGADFQIKSWSWDTQKGEMVVHGTWVDSGRTGRMSLLPTQEVPCLLANNSNLRKRK